MQGKKQSPSNGIWDQWTADKYHKSSEKLAIFLCRYLNSKIPVYDFGCGQGYYLKELTEAGFNCTGVEGFELNNFLHYGIFIHDLTEPMRLHQQGQVLSFEVGEHLPPEAEQTFLNTLTENCNSKLIMSWATPGQPGVGHINCKDQQYIITEVVRRGFRMNYADTLIIRKNVDKECDWLERNLLIFDREHTFQPFKG